MAADIPTSMKELPTSEPRWVGRRVRRTEDASLLTGRTEFIDDVQMPGMLHCAILRSPLAHARIHSVDVSAALALEYAGAGQDERELRELQQFPVGDLVDLGDRRGRRVVLQGEVQRHAVLRQEAFLRGIGAGSMLPTPGSLARLL